MNSSPANRAAAREIIVPTRTEEVSESILPSQKQKWWFWSGACFATVLLAAFARPLLVLINYAAWSELRSYILLVPFVSAYLLYIQIGRAHV